MLTMSLVLCFVQINSGHITTCEVTYLRIRKVPQHVQGHADGKCWSQYLNPNGLILEPTFLVIMPRTPAQLV